MGKYIYQVLMEPEDKGEYSIYVPDLPGCVTCGSDFRDGLEMAADCLKTFIASLLVDGFAIPEPTEHPCPEGWKSVWIAFETDENYIVEKDSVSAAEAARRLGVSRARVSVMLKTGILEGYREFRSTWVTVESIERRLASHPKAGRPRKHAGEAGDIGAGSAADEVPAVAAPAAPAASATASAAPAASAVQ